MTSNADETVRLTSTGHLTPANRLAFMRRTAPYQPPVRSSKLELNTMRIHSFRSMLLPKQRHWPAHHPTQEWREATVGGYRPTPLTPTHRRAYMIDIRLYRLTDGHRSIDGCRPTEDASVGRTFFSLLIGCTMGSDARLWQRARLTVGGARVTTQRLSTSRRPIVGRLPQMPYGCQKLSALTTACGTAA